MGLVWTSARAVQLVMALFLVCHAIDMQIISFRARVSVNDGGCHRNISDGNRPTIESDEDCSRNTSDGRQSANESNGHRPAKGSDGHQSPNESDGHKTANDNGDSYPDDDASEEGVYEVQ